MKGQGKVTKNRLFMTESRFFQLYLTFFFTEGDWYGIFILLRYYLLTGLPQNASLSFRSTQPCLKVVWMNACSWLVHWALFAEVCRLPLSHFWIASCWCHQQSWCFASGQTQWLAPISAISLSVWTKHGTMPYSLHKVAAYVSNALVCFPSFSDNVIVKRQ